MCFLGHIWTRSTACEGIPYSLQLDGGLSLSPVPLHVCGGVPIRQRRPLHQLHRHRSKCWPERDTSPRYWWCCTSHDVAPLFTSILSALTTGRIVAFIRCAMGARCRCNYELLYHFRKKFLDFMLPLHERNQINHPTREWEIVSFRLSKLHFQNHKSDLDETGTGNPQWTFGSYQFIQIAWS
jgi:hypothetical protein